MTDAASRLQSAVADRYRIERELGRGGMVAIKVMGARADAPIEPERFLREIEMATRLSRGARSSDA